MSLSKYMGESSSAHSFDASDGTVDSSVANDFWEDFAFTDGIQKSRVQGKENTKMHKTKNPRVPHQRIPTTDV